MRTKIIVVAAILAIICAIIFWPSDKKKIMANLDALADYCSPVSGESVIETVKEVTLATKLFTDPFQVRIDSRKIDRQLSSKELSDRLLMLRKRLPNTTYSFDDKMVTLSGDTTATISTTLLLESESLDEQFTDAYELQANAVKVDGKWLFSSFTLIEFMQK